jgi:hypothetical protein
MAREYGHCRQAVGPPLARIRSRAAALEHGGSFYVFGGKNDGIVVRFDIPSQQWTSLPPLSEALSYVAAGAIGNELHVFGGFDAQGAPVDTHENLVVPSP